MNTLKTSPGIDKKEMVSILSDLIFFHYLYSYSIQFIQNNIKGYKKHNLFT
jgi:hypothetical protein